MAPKTYPITVGNPTDIEPSTTSTTLIGPNTERKAPLINRRAATTARARNSRFPLRGIEERSVGPLVEATRHHPC